MTGKSLKPGETNILISQAGWAWPQALKQIFKPSGVNLLMAESSEDFINVAGHKRVHIAIIDMDSEKVNGLATLKIMKKEFPLLPCILLSSRIEQPLLDTALKLDVFSVIDKPVDLEILRQQLNRLFHKKYNSDVFA